MTTPFSGLELLATAVLMLDDRLHVTYANPAAETLLAHGRKHLLGTPLAKVLPGNDRLLARLAQAVEDDAGFNENELALELGGQTVTLHCVASPVDEDGARLLVELRELDQQMQHRARGEAPRAAAGQPRADPQPRPRDQEPAGRHPRRGAAPRARAAAIRS